jgi:hypothetical protein
MTSIKKVIDPKENISLKSAQETVGGYVERVRCPDDTILLINEEGLLEGLPVNEEASTIAGQMIVGDVIHFAKGCGKDWN